jgi:hypothetical protein
MGLGGVAPIVGNYPSFYSSSYYLSHARHGRHQRFIGIWSRGEAFMPAGYPSRTKFECLIDATQWHGMLAVCAAM